MRGLEGDLLRFPCMDLARGRQPAKKAGNQTEDDRADERAKEPVEKSFCLPRHRLRQGRI